MIQSLARDYSSLGPRRSIAALVPSLRITQLAVLLGVPVSFNEIVGSAVAGSGAAVGGRRRQRADGPRDRRRLDRVVRPRVRAGLLLPAMLHAA
jgi:phosphate/sulfate permease